MLLKSRIINVATFAAAALNKRGTTYEPAEFDSLWSFTLTLFTLWVVADGDDTGSAYFNLIENLDLY